MKVLVYLSPVIESANPIIPQSWYREFLPRLVRAWQGLGYEPALTLLMNESMRKYVDHYHLPVIGRLVTVKQRELLADYDYNALEEMTRYQEHKGGEAFVRHLGDVVMRTLGDDFHPDAIVSFTPAQFLLKTYPNAFFFHHEYGMLSRHPYPVTLIFDTSGYGHNYYISTHAAELNRRPVSETERTALAVYRRKMQEVLTACPAIGEYFAGLRKKYRRILLLPLGSESYYETRMNTTYQGQFELVEHVMDSVREDTAVILTQHPLVPAVDERSILWLQKIYGNLCYEDWFTGIDNFSQIALAYVDGLVGLWATLGIQAALLGRHFISLNGFCTGIADGVSLMDIDETLDRPVRDRDAFLSWVLRHYLIPEEDLPRFFASVLNSHRLGRAFEWPEMFPVSEFPVLLERYGAFAGECQKEVAEAAPYGLKAVEARSPLARMWRASAERDYLRGELDEKRKEITTLYRSPTYRVGKILMMPLRLLDKILGRGAP